MIIALVLLLIAITVWIFGSLPWLVFNYFVCIPEPTLACTLPTKFESIAQNIVIVNVLLIVLAGVAIAHLRNLHRRHRRRQELAASRQGTDPASLG
ncbi:MAG: hypothetical protein F6K09_09025 [Merismopedia sp. SIO2A8]|nr:hypothetical protein [Merismopedia sp. SIO2A8]